MSSVLSDLGNLHIVTGIITGSGTDSTVESNDGSVSITGNAAGDYTITFGSAFLSTPVMSVNAVAALGTTTDYATDGVKAMLDTVSTDSAIINVVEDTGGTDDGVQADGNVHFIAIGLRNI